MNSWHLVKCAGTFRLRHRLQMNLAGLHVVEAQALEVPGRSVYSQSSAGLVGTEKGDRSRFVPTHRELRAAFR